MVFVYIALVFFAIAPALWLIRNCIRKDLYPEPKGLIIKTALIGVLIALPVFIFEIFLASVYYKSGLQSHFLWSLFFAFIVAGFTEETFKFIVLKKYCSVKSAFDEPMDAIVYSVMVSLGFALFENILYVFQSASEGGVGAGLGVAALRAITAVPAHASFGVVMGYYFSEQMFLGKKESFLGYPKALYFPILLHGSYNFLILLGSAFSFLLFVPFFIYLLKMARRMHRQRIEEQKYTEVIHFN